MMLYSLLDLDMNLSPSGKIVKRAGDTMAVTLHIDASEVAKVSWTKVGLSSLCKSKHKQYASDTVKQSVAVLENSPSVAYIWTPCPALLFIDHRKDNLYLF